MIRRTVCIFILFILVFFNISTLEAQAASSTAVTSSFESKDLSGENFVGRNLQLAEFTKTKLQGANFQDADLRGAVFNSVTAQKANLQGADLTNVLTYVSNFDEANLTNAILREAIMKRSTFNNAKINGADFTYSILDNQQIKQFCEYADGVNPVTGASTRQSLGCP